MREFSVSLPESAAASFDRLIKSGTYPHSSVLTGNDEQKLLDVAFDLAGALVCSGEDAPCGECANCVKSQKHIHPDIKVISPQEKRKSVNMEECREMIMDSFIMPNEAERKVYIITSAHTLDERVQNSLLKTLEEPPQYAYFILLCINSSALLGTVLSRVSVFPVGNSEQDDTADEKVKEITDNIIRALFDINEIELIRASVPLDRDRRLFKSVMEQFRLEVNASLRAKNGLGTDGSGMASRFTAQELYNLDEIAASLISAAERNANERLLITLMSARFKRAIGG